MKNAFLNYSLESFHKEFINLKNRKLLDVLKEAINCQKIDECVKKTFVEFINPIPNPH